MRFFDQIFFRKSDLSCSDWVIAILIVILWNFSRFQQKLNSPFVTSQVSTKILKSPKISKLGLQLPDYYRVDLTVASICHQISRSYFQNAWEIPLEPRFFFQKKWKSNFDSKKFRLFCANKAVLSVLSKEPRFLTKTTGIFFMPKNSYFFLFA